MIAIFAVVAAVGTLAGSAQIILNGPVKTMSQANQSTLTESQVTSSARMIMLDVENLVNAGDCDDDRIIEPREWRTGTGPTGGGLIPFEVGAAKRDAWGTEFGYCGWDHGSLIDGITSTGDECGATNRLEGTNDRSYPAIAIISAGPNGIFESTCHDWSAADLDDDGGGMTPDGDLDDTGDNPLFEPGGDDVYVVYSYAEAVEELPTLWKEDSPDVWQLDMDTDGLEVVATDDVEFSGSNVFAPTRMEMVGDLGLLLPDETQLTDAECTAGDAEGQIRLNKTSSPPVLEVCESNTIESLEGGASASPPTPTSVGLVGYWTFDETSGAIINDSAGNNDGTWEDDTDDDITYESVEGRVGTGLYLLDSDYPRISIPAADSINNLSELSFCIWVKFENTVGASWAFLGKTGGAPIAEQVWRSWVNVFGGRTLSFMNPMNDRITTTTGLDENEWYHTCGTWDGTDGTAGMKIYLNGVEQAVTSSVNSGGVDDSSYYLQVGSETGSSTSMRGVVDDFRLYDEALTASEIQDIYGYSIYVTQANINQSADSTNTIGTTGFTIIKESDTIGDSAGIAFKIDNTVAITDAVSAAIFAQRQASGNSNLAFRTYNGLDASTRMVIAQNDAQLALTSNADIDIDTSLQIGEHYDAWNTNFEDGVLITRDDLTTDQYVYYGAKNYDDASTYLMYSDTLRFLKADNGTQSIYEYLRFDNSGDITASGDLAVTDENSDAAMRIEEYSGTAANSPVFIFSRKRGSANAVEDSDVIGSIVFKGNDGAFPDNGQLSITGLVNGTVATGNVPIDLVIGADSAGAASSNEVMRITSDGDIGVGVAAPEARLHASGRIQADNGFKIGDDPTCSTITDAGTLSYDSGAYYLCDGTTLGGLSGSGSGSGASDCEVIPFDFQDRDALSASTTYNTNTILVGILSGSCNLTASSDSASFTINKNGTDVTGNSTSVEAGDRIYLKIRSSASNAGYASTYVTIGSHTDEILFQTEGKLVFMTSTGTQGNIGGVMGADAFCQKHADAEGLKGDFRAMISDSITNAADRLRQYNTPYYRVDGVKVADNWGDLMDGSLDNDIRVDETGGTLTIAVWTNSYDDGTIRGSNHCNDWTSNSSGLNGSKGESFVTNYQWIDAGTYDCSQWRRLYCFEQ